MRKSAIILTLILSFLMRAQVGINTQNPAATLDVTHKAGSPAGIIAPRVTADELINNDANYGANQNGAIVFVTDLATGSPTVKTKDINMPGYYFFSSLENKWINIATGAEPWYNSKDRSPASSNSQDIYQTGQVGIGTSSIDPNAQLEVASNTKGVLLPRMSSSQRNAIPQNITNGLLIFNNTTNCFNYYVSSSNKWLSLCGTYEPATFNLLNCNTPTGANGTYTKSATLNNTNTYTIPVNVSSIGTFQIILKTNNGYSFSKSGNFTQTGPQNIIIDGQGTPVSGPQTDAIASLEFNGMPITPSCTLPGINILGNTTAFAVNCSGAKAFGNYLTGIALDGTNYIDLPITSVTTPGNVLVETASINGIKFSSGNTNITASTTSIRLYGQGTPTSVGTNSYSATIPGSSACSISITTASSYGTYANPANRCIEIKSDNTAAADGYYWLKDSNNNKFKTYCDMSNGGWTLVNSRSERQLLQVDKTQGTSLVSFTPKNLVTTQSGIFNEYNFSLSSDVISNMSYTGGTQEIRIIIKENGSTGSTVTDVEASTKAPINDIWAKENYWNISITDGNNPFRTNYIKNGYTSEGKIFNSSFGKPVTGATNYNFRGINFTTAPPGFYSSANFFTGFYGASAYAGTGVIVYNYTSDSSKSFTYNKSNINDLFGLYHNAEAQLNHHIGTCSNSTDDYGGAASCAAGWANWRAHKFNSVNGNYEGRILQYYVK